MSRDWDDVADLVEEYIEDKAKGGNRLRRSYLAAMADNKWRNRAFNNLVDAILAAEGQIERKYARRGDDFIDYMEAAVPDIVNGHFAMSCLADRDVSDSLEDRVYNEMRDAVALYEDLVDPPNERRGGRDDRGRGRDRGGRDDRDRDRGRGADEYRRDTDRDTGRRSSGRRDERDYRRSDEKSSKAGGSQWDLVAGARNDEDDREDDRRNDRRDERDDPAPARRAEPVQQPKPEPKPERPRINGPDFTKPRPFDDFWRDNEHWQVEFLSKWELTGDGKYLSSRVPKFYDVNRFVKYLVKDQDGNVREELEEVNEDNRYLAHQLLDNPDQRPTTRTSAGVSLKALQGQQQAQEEAQEAPSEPDVTVPLAELVDEFKVPAVNFNVETNLAGCVYRARSTAIAEEAHTAVTWQLVRTPLLASGWDQLDLIQQVHDTGGLAAAAVKMRELRPKFDEAIFSELNKRFSTLFLRAISYQFQQPGITKFSFVEHWEDALGWFDKKRGATETAEFANRTRYIVSMACQHIARDELPNVMEDLVAGAKGIPPTVVFADFYLLASIDKTLDAAGIGAQLEKSKAGVIVTQTSNRELREGLVTLFQQANANLGAQTRIRVCIATSDNRLVEIIPYANRQDNFILAPLSMA